MCKNKTIDLQICAVVDFSDKFDISGGVFGFPVQVL